MMKHALALPQRTCGHGLYSFALAVAAYLGAAQGGTLPAEIIESVTDDAADADGREAQRSKGGPRNNKLENTDSPTRAGKRAFRHWVSQQGERSELAMQRTEIGGTYWYGWSMYLPEDFDHRGSDTIVMQLAT